MGRKRTDKRKKRKKRKSLEGLANHQHRFSWPRVDVSYARSRLNFLVRGLYLPLGAISGKKHGIVTLFLSLSLSYYAIIVLLHPPYLRFLPTYKKEAQTPEMIFHHIGVGHYTLLLYLLMYLG